MVVVISVLCGVVDALTDSNKAMVLWATFAFYLLFPAIGLFGGAVLIKELYAVIADLIKEIQQRRRAKRASQKKYRCWLN